MDQTTIIIIAIVAVLLLLCFLLGIASFSSDKFIEEYKRLSTKLTNSPYTASAFIKILNMKYLSNKVSVYPIRELGGDFYNSKKKVVGLNMSNEKSLASFAVIAHELGHAYQDIVEGKLGSFNSLRKAGMIIGKLCLPILIAGIVSLFFVENYLLVIVATVSTLAIIILLAIIIKTKTIGVEKDASARGLEFLKEFLSDDEVKQCKKLLDSARLTYWGDLIKLLFGWSGLTSTTKMFK